MEPIQVLNNGERQQFQAMVDGEVASLEYRLQDGKIVLMHTEVPEKIGGHGIGGALAEFAFKYARAKGMPVKVYCPFVQAYLKRHPEYQDMVAEG